MITTRDVKSLSKEGAAKLKGDVTLSEGAGVTLTQAGNDIEIASSASAPEGTAVLSTGEAGGTKFLREDGDGTCSWQTVSGAGASTALDNLASVAINTSLISDTDSTDDLGSTTKQWANVHTDRLLSTISDLTIENDLEDGDIIFKVNDGGVDTIAMMIDGATHNIGMGTSNPTFQLTNNKTTTSINNINSSFLLKTTTTGDMVDGFGGGILWAIEDTATVENYIAGISAIRDGADDSGALVVRTKNAGTFNNNFIIKPNGNSGFGIATANISAVLHIKAGTATAGTAPLKLTSGTNLTTPEAGAVEYDGYNLYHTPVSTRNTVLTTGRVSSEASSATPTINTDRVDAHSITALATAITSMTTNLSGTPTNFQKLIIRIKDDGTARAIAWGASFEAKGVALPTTTVISKVLTVGFIYDTVTSKWGCVASAQEA